MFTDEKRSMVYAHRDGLHSTSLPKVSTVCSHHLPLQPTSSGTLSPRISKSESYIMCGVPTVEK